MSIYVPKFGVIAQAVFPLERGYTHRQTRVVGYTQSKTPLITLYHASATPAWHNNKLGGGKWTRTKLKGRASKECMPLEHWLS